jgi:hypothetical protein
MTHTSRSYKSKPKTDWRGLNATAVRRIGIKFPNQKLLDRTGKLRGRFLDLAGEDTRDVLEAYEGLLPSPSKLLLVDHAWDTFYEGVQCVKDLPKERRPRVIYNDAYQLSSSINQRSNKNDNEELIGVFSLDLVNYASAEWWFNEGLRFMECAVMPAIREFKACVLLLNHTLDGKDGYEKSVDRIESHIDGLRKVLAAKFNGGRGDVPRGSFLPDQEDVRESLLNGDFVGWLNRVHIYRSRVLRMATLRLYLQDSNFHACNEEYLS